jgi:hypothetical protein
LSSIVNGAELSEYKPKYLDSEEKKDEEAKKE